MDRSWASLNSAGLKAQLDRNDRLINRCEVYTNFGKTPEGQFYVETDLPDSIKFIRDQYKNIDITSPHCISMLSAMQEREKVYVETLAKFMGSKDYAAGLRKQNDEIREFIKKRREIAATDHMIPTPLITKEDAHV